MKLFCEKYKKEYESEDALCEHREEYCKFRESCIINFLAEERRREKERKEGAGADSVAPPADRK